MKKRRSTTEILEGERKKGVEHLYAGHLGEEPAEMGSEQGVGSVTFDVLRLEEFKKRRVGKGYYSLHTHPIAEEDLEKNYKDRTEGRNCGPSIPSEEDFRDFFKHRNEKTMRIAQQNPDTGKVAGYYIIKKTKKTPDIPELDRNKFAKYGRREYLPKIKEWYKQHPLAKKFSDDLYSYHRNTVFEVPPDSEGQLVVRDKSDGELNQSEMNKLASNYGLKIRTVPAKGFYYEHGIGFKKVSKKSLESKVAVVLLISGFLISICFLYSNITAFAIFGLNGSSMNRIGAGFFVISLIGYAVWQFLRRLRGKELGEARR